jgi:hypothetical protein
VCRFVNVFGAGAAPVQARDIHACQYRRHGGLSAVRDRLPASDNADTQLQGCSGLHAIGK